MNTLAPYILTAQIERPAPPDLSQQRHASQRELFARRRGLAEAAWDQTQAYCDSKLYVTALAFAVARLWPDVLSNAVDPGWVPTKMGGAGATDDLELGHLTQTWLAVSDDPAGRVSGRYWHHRRMQTPAAAVADTGFQERLIAKLAELTGIRLL